MGNRDRFETSLGKADEDGGKQENWVEFCVVLGELGSVKGGSIILASGPVVTEFFQPRSEAVLADLCKAIEHAGELFEFGVHPAD